MDLVKRMTGRRTLLTLAATLSCTWATFSATLAVFDHAARPESTSAGAA